MITLCGTGEKKERKRKKRATHSVLDGRRRYVFQQRASVWDCREGCEELSARSGHWALSLSAAANSVAGGFDLIPLISGPIFFYSGQLVVICRFVCLCLVQGESVDSNQSESKGLLVDCVWTTCGQPTFLFWLMMESFTTSSRWTGYLFVGLIVMAELVTVSGRGQVDWRDSFGPKERRKRQTGNYITIVLLQLKFTNVPHVPHTIEIYSIQNTIENLTDLARSCKSFG